MEEYRARYIGRSVYEIWCTTADSTCCSEIIVDFRETEDMIFIIMHGPFNGIQRGTLCNMTVRFVLISIDDEKYSYDTRAFQNLLCARVLTYTDDNNSHVLWEYQFLKY